MIAFEAVPMQAAPKPIMNLQKMHTTTNTYFCEAGMLLAIPKATNVPPSKKQPIKRVTFLPLLLINELMIGNVVIYANGYPSMIKPE
jgi:hypothetical protein